jgi:hypothetical protein
MVAKLLKWFDGWKRIAAYAGLQVFGEYPLVVGAFKKVLEDPSAQNLGELILQALLAYGVLDAIAKKVKDVFARIS